MIKTGRTISYSSSFFTEAYIAQSFKQQKRGDKKAFLSGKTDVSLDYEVLQLDGRRMWLRTNIHLFTDIKGHLKGYLYLVDIDKQKREEVRLTQQAERDLSTGLYNKETARAKMEIALKLYDKPDTCAFFMIDLDYFKTINDTYGHAAGDFVVKRTADVLKESFREEDIIGRLGGDEFGILYVGKNSSDILIKKAERICQAIMEIHPDAALYITKKQKNRNGFTIYSEDLPLDKVGK